MAKSSGPTKRTPPRSRGLPRRRRRGNCASHRRSTKVGLSNDDLDVSYRGESVMRSPPAQGGHDWVPGARLHAETSRVVPARPNPSGRANTHLFHAPAQAHGSFAAELSHGVLDSGAATRRAERGHVQRSEHRLWESGMGAGKALAAGVAANDSPVRRLGAMSQLPPHTRNRGQGAERTGNLRRLEWPFPRDGARNASRSSRPRNRSFPGPGQAPLAELGSAAGGQTLASRRHPHRMVASRAGVTQLAECLLPKQNVAGSNPVSRSTFPTSLG